MPNYYSYILLSLSLPILGIFSRMAGGWQGKDKRPTTKVLMQLDKYLVGIILGLLFAGMNELSALTFLYAALLGGVASFIAHNIYGTGHPKGYITDGYESGDGKLEGWQPEFLRHRPWWSVALLGALFGLTFALCLWPLDVAAWWFLPAFTAAFPMAMYLGKHSPNLPGEFAYDAWTWSEVYQIPIAVVLFATFLYSFAAGQ